MARQQCTLPLIIVSLLLATVITAFRIRDLSSKSSAERHVSSRRNPLLEKCDGCDSEHSSIQKHLSGSALKIKEIASRRSYEDIKKAVKEKQQNLNEKKHQQKPPVPKYAQEDSDDDDDDDDSEEERMITKFQSEQKKRNIRVEHKNVNIDVKVNKATKGILPVKAVNKLKQNEDSDDDDDDDDDDQDDDSEGNDRDNDSKGDGGLDDEINDIDDEDVDDDDDDDDDSNSEADNKSKNDDSDKSEDSYVDVIIPKMIISNSKQTIINKKVAATNVKDQQQLKNNELVKKPIRTYKYLEDSGDGDDDSDGERKPEVPATKLSLTLSTDTDDENDSDDNDLLLKQKTVILKHTNEVNKQVKQMPFKHFELSEQKTPSNNKEPQLKDTKTAPHTEKKHIVKEEPKKEQKSQHDTKNIKHEEHSNKPSKPPVQPTKDHKELQKDKKDEITKHKSKDEKIKDVPAKETKRKEPEKPSPAQAKQDRKDTTHDMKKHDFQHTGSSFLKHASDALHRKYFLQNEFEDFYAFLPSFAPNFTRIHNAECRRHGQILMRQLRGTKLWALNMLDASGKVPAGLLQGNGNQLGDFDQCLGSKARVRLESGHVVKIHGRYCLAQIDIKSDDPELQLPIHLAQGRNLLKSKIDDPGHFIPRFSSLNWGVCVPAACGAEDAEFLLRDALRHYHHAGLHLGIKVDALNCHEETEEWWDRWLEPPTLITVCLFSIILLIVLYATLLDFCTRRGKDHEQASEEQGGASDEGDTEKEPDDRPSKTDQGSDEGIISSFSVYRSGARLFRAGDVEDIACIHGVRAICSLALVLAHKIIPVANTPYTNRIQLTELSHTPLSYMLRVGWLYTDAFLLLSGALTAHRLSADLDSGAGMPWLRRFIARYFRLTPALVCVVLFYAYVWDNLGAGPLWGTLVTRNAQLCQENWWWNVLYVQNFFNFDEICAPQTYQLALDMQLTLTAAALVWFIRRRTLHGAGLVVALHAAAAYARYQATVDHRLSLLIYHGASVSQMYRTARLSYTSTLHRATPYIAGVTLGVLLQRQPSRSISKMILVPCWLACAGCTTAALYAARDAAAADTRYSSSSAGSYAALAPISAAGAISWIIYAAHSGNAEWVNRLLCARPLVLISRLSYAMYLIQFLIFFYDAGTVRAAAKFSVLSIIDVQEFLAILAASVVITMTLVIPMQSLSKYVMTYELGSKEEKNEETPETEPQETEGDQNEERKEVEEEMEAQESYIIEEPFNGKRIMVHRELLEEIVEAEIEYEIQRDNRDEGLEEILEEEEDEMDVIEEEEEPEELEIVEGEEPEAGPDNFWADRDEDTYQPPRRLSRAPDNDEDVDEWEWTTNGQNAGSSYRYAR